MTYTVTCPFLDLPLGTDSGPWELPLLRAALFYGLLVVTSLPRKCAAAFHADAGVSQVGDFVVDGPLSVLEGSVSAIVGSHDLGNRVAYLRFLPLVDSPAQELFECLTHALARAKDEEVRVALLKLCEEDLFKAIAQRIVAASPLTRSLGCITLVAFFKVA